MGVNRKVGAVTAIAFDAHAFLGGVAFVLQGLAVRAGYGLGHRVVVEVLGGVGLSWAGLPTAGGTKTGTPAWEAACRSAPAP